MTAGTDAFVAESPRVAIFLNLLMPGFGYFYLGKRLLGIVVFLGLWVLQSFFSHDLQDAKDVREQWGTIWGMSIVLELVSIGLAVDVYKMRGSAKSKSWPPSNSLPGSQAISPRQFRSDLACCWGQAILQLRLTAYTCRTTRT